MTNNSKIDCPDSLETLKISDDILLISFDEQPYSAFLSTPMTTLAQQNETLGAGGGESFTRTDWRDRCSGLRGDPIAT